VYHDGRGKEPMIDVGSMTPAVAVYIRFLLWTAGDGTRRSSKLKAQSNRLTVPVDEHHRAGIAAGSAAEQNKLSCVSTTVDEVWDHDLFAGWRQIIVHRRRCCH